MTDEHITQEQWRAVQSRPQPAKARLAKALVARALAHLLAGCAICRAEFEAHLEEAAASGRDALAGDLFAALREALPSSPLPKPSVGEAEEAATLLRELLSLPRGERAAAVTADPARYHGEALAEALLAECRASLPGDAARAEHFAGLVRLTLEQTRPSPAGADLYALATAHLANARRATDDLAGADAWCRQARHLLRLQGASRLAAAAEVDAIEGALRRDQRQLPAAAALLERAVLGFRLEGEGLEAARYLLTLGMVRREQHDLDAAITATQEAIVLLDDGEADPRLYLLAWHNLAWLLCDQGEFLEAKNAVLSIQDFYARFPDPWTQLRKAWVEARIAAGLGQVELAEGMFLAVADGFKQDYKAYDCALVSLELAGLYLDQGRMADIIRLVEEIVPVFLDRAIHREAIAALMLVEEAAKRQHLTHAYLTKTATSLEEARRRAR